MQDEEEAQTSLLRGEQELDREALALQHRRHFGRIFGALTLAGAATAAAAICYSSGAGRSFGPHQVGLSEALGPRAVEAEYFEGKAEEEVPQPVSDAPEREKARAKLDIEVDLSGLVSVETLGRDAISSAPADASECKERAGALFDRVTKWSGLHHELSNVESQAFRGRFIKALEQSCIGDVGSAEHRTRWLQLAAQTLEEQKPAMTAALAHSLNGAGFGFQVEMQDWMVNESKATLQFRYGREAKLPADANVTKPDMLRQAGRIPEQFNSILKWPHCKQEILHIFNQGSCGSCWSFSCTQVLNARICINSHHLFDGHDLTLAPGYFASCAANNGSPGDGCQGGWEYFCYKYIDRADTPGGVSEDCDPYFASHWWFVGGASQCPTNCQAGYPRSLEDDGFKLPGVGKYLLVVKPDEAAHLVARQAIYEGGSINFGIFSNHAFYAYRRGVYDLCNEESANHAVVAYGYFPGGYYSKNSWGDQWGLGGYFMIANCIMTDFTVPGNFDASHSHIPEPWSSGQQQ